MTIDEARREIRKYRGGWTDLRGGSILFTCPISAWNNSREQVAVAVGTWHPGRSVFEFPGPLEVACDSLEKCVNLVVGAIASGVEVEKLPRTPSKALGPKQPKALPGSKGRRIIRKSDPMS